ncbi:MAG: tRNA dihydrouridine synthase DusB [Candidatus Aenigmarchaeota archaeon]|nr:tRNA dihydrouridine synthase DusB [Candidatus Aenigmarchaeota archaeon]
MKKFPKLKGKAILAPMAGVTDVSFRVLAKRYGAAMTYTEFVSSAGLMHENEKTLRLIQTSKEEDVIGVQIFGHEVEEIVGAAEMLQNMFDVIDINCGCPAQKVVKVGAGSELMKDPQKIGKIVNKTASVVNKPVTIKIRKGIDEKHINALEVAKIAEDAGASAITIHGRTQKQDYSGEADWGIVKKLKESVNIPVIGNGDITSPEIFEQRLEESGVDAIMIGRATLSNPYIFRQIEDYIKTGSYEKKNGIEQFFEYLEITRKFDVVFDVIKNHALWLTKGIRGGAEMRQQITLCRNLRELEDIMSG